MSKKVSIVPLENRVLIEPIDEQAGGDILRPGTSEKKRPSQGRVLAIGETYKGRLKVGDFVFFQKYGVEELVVKKLIYYVALPEDVLVIIK